MSRERPAMTALHRALRAVLVCATCMCAGIATGCSSYVTQSDRIKSALARHEPQKALQEIERIDKSKSELLYLYERGLALHYQNEHTQSNEAFERAELLLEELYTKSLTREAAALLVSDTIAKYRGESFEAVFVNYYKMLNYIYLDDLEGALVECRRLNDKLQLIRDAEDGAFTDVPFLQYLTGTVYRLGGELVDADVSYRVALDGYRALDGARQVPVPATLYCDLALNSLDLGDLAASAAYAEHCPKSRNRSDGVGVLTLFLECGWIAYKSELEIAVPIFKDELDGDDFEATAFSRTLVGRYRTPRHYERKLEYLLKVAIPRLEVPAARVTHAIVRPRGPSDHAGVRTVLADDLDAWAIRAYEQREGTILFRTLLRGLGKYLAKRQVSNKDEVLGWLVNAVNIATETADTRGWSTLPARIHMARIELPPGTYDLEVDVHGSGNVTERFTIPEVVFEAGRSEIMNYRIYR